MPGQVKVTQTKAPLVLNFNGSALTLEGLAEIGEMLERDGCLTIHGVFVPDWGRRTADNFQHEMRNLDRQPNPREDFIRALAKVGNVELLEWDRRVLFATIGTYGQFFAHAVAFLRRKCGNPHGCRLAETRVSMSTERAVGYRCGCRVSPCVVPLDASEDFQENAFLAAADALDSDVIQEQQA